MRLLIHLNLEDLRGLTNFCDDFNDSSNLYDLKFRSASIRNIEYYGK